MKSRIRINEYNILSILIIYMPLHYYLCDIILKNSQVDNILRDIVIVFLFVIHLYKYGLKTSKIGLLIAIIAIIMFFQSIVSVVNGNPYAINSLRTYVVPSLLYFIVKDLKIDCKKAKKLLYYLLVEMALIGIWGLFQAFVLGDSFLVRIGYPTVEGHLGASYYINGYYGHQRSVGTFISANYCGLILAIFILLAVSLDYYRKKKIGNVIIICLAISLVATISRSSILALAIAIVYYVFFEWKISAKTIVKILTVIFAGMVIIIIVDRFALNGMLSKMVIDGVSSALSFNDASSRKHMMDLFEPINTVLENFFGTGFGNNGPMVLSKVKDAYNVESSIYLMMLETGAVFGLLYYIPFIRCIVMAPFSSLKRKKVSATVVLLVFITFIFLPNVQCFEILFYVYIALGVYDNRQPFIT